jgi:hypothetical protein
MEAQDFESITPPWFDVTEWENWVKSKDVIISKGRRHNRTDGEVHYILKYNETICEFYSNYWDWKTPGWQESIDWINKLDIL